MPPTAPSVTSAWRSAPTVTLAQRSGEGGGPRAAWEGGGMAAADGGGGRLAGGCR
ncbi:hypothetical protein [Mycobacterium sp. 20KCMC460]|uniref:hypothetical protein n=1 Tax=Mycobacterium sp. 20KCMC460 TaxID=2903536 RepID=UPI001EE2CA94|nr:hypothetical protein [Mycobacterium sp. 20KCMC460]